MLKRLHTWLARSPESDTVLQALLKEYAVTVDLQPSPVRLREYTQIEREAVKNKLREALAERFPQQTWVIALLHNHLAIAPDHRFNDKEFYYILYWDVEALAGAIRAIKH